MKQYQLFELEFHGAEPEGSRAVIDMEAVFTWKSARTGEQKSKKVKGFYDGNHVYKVRFLPEEAGEYQWQVTGCFREEGCENCEPAKEYDKGIIRANGIRFEYSDGTAFLPVGTTIYALAHQEEKQIAQTMETLKTAPFNKVRHCVFPKYYEYNHNDPRLYAFEKDTDGNWDVNRPCFEFWKHLENVIFRLAAQGIQSDLILFHPYDKWGFSILSMEQCRIYLDYLLRRLAAIPEIWWSMANEFDLMYARTMDEWYEIEEFIAANDPYHHLLSNHNCFSFYDFTRPNITHCCVQTTQLESAAMWLEKYQKPLIYDECCYEGNLPMSWGNLSGFEMANKFWQACVPGAYASHGEVFLDENEVLWWSKGGMLKGSSPERITFLKGILEELPGTLEPWKQKQWELPDQGLMSKAPEDFFKKLYDGMPKEQQESMREKDGICCGHVGDQVFLEYFGRRCCGMVRWILPEDHTYRIEMIDIWEMTRKVVYRGVKGKFAPVLPGKEGIALMAVAEF
ncbi:MAG: DUF4038 domain-containing protein [Eubacteriales bacterium]|nr:DUF4038 domain-containing protein [Eubacteriales bacterium]